MLAEEEADIIAGIYWTDLKIGKRIDKIKESTRLSRFTYLNQK